LSFESKDKVIEVEHVYFSYDNVPVLEDICFSVERKDFCVIIGPNGGGKTTLLKLLLGILKPDKGTIKILGKNPNDVRHKLGYLPQYTDFKLSFPISVMDVALMGRLNKRGLFKRFTDEDRKKVEEILKMLGMWEYRNVHIGRLSGGQRQRVFIARALATEPEILFLDEPTARVDPEHETGLYEILRELNKRMTIVVITHDIGVISRYARSIACVNRKLVFHEEGKITEKMLEMAYECPVDLIAHGIPHRVLPEHKHE